MHHAVQAHNQACRHRRQEPARAAAAATAAAAAAAHFLVLELVLLLVLLLLLLRSVPLLRLLLLVAADAAAAAAARATESGDHCRECNTSSVQLTMVGTEMIREPGWPMDHTQRCHLALPVAVTKRCRLVCKTDPCTRMGISYKLARMLRYSTIDYIHVLQLLLYYAAIIAATVGTHLSFKHTL